MHKEEETGNNEIESRKNELSLNKVTDMYVIRRNELD